MAVSVVNVQLVYVFCFVTEIEMASSAFVF